MKENGKQPAEKQPGIERTANKVSNGTAAPAVGVFLKPVQ